MLIQKSNHWQPILQELQTSDFLAGFYHSAIAHRLRIAVWRFPNEQKPNAIVDLSGSHDTVGINLAVLPAGFLVTPFANQAENSSYLIKAQLFWDGTTCAFLGDLAGNERIIENMRRMLHSIKEWNHNHRNDSGKRPDFPRWFRGRTQDAETFEATEDQYWSWVNEAVRQIKSKRLRKVVLARNVKLPLTESFDPLILFQDLCRHYPNAFVSVVALPGIGTWIGATPELFIRLHDHELTTVALASTQKVSDEKKVVWDEKELEEQEIVSDYIRECFLQQNIDTFDETGPETLRIGDLLHLQTQFDLKLAAENGIQSANRLLQALHPTPAVCGVPKAKALEFIREREIQDREFYAGHLGPINFHGRTNLFVNLRCLQLQGNSAILYAGAGITRDSIPEQEWLETELKLNSLRAFLDNGPASEPRSEPGIKNRERKVLCEQGI